METKYKGQIANFPDEIINKILEKQVEQGNPKNINVFEDYVSSYKETKGFNWGETIEGHNFWEKIIDGDFNVFFEKYPKQKIIKSYNNISEIIYEMITTHPYFKSLFKNELLEIIQKMNYKEQCKLKEEHSQKQVENLIKQFNIEKNNSETRKIEKYIVKVPILVGLNDTYFHTNSEIQADDLESLPYFKSLGLTDNPNILKPYYEAEFKVGDFVTVKKFIEGDSLGKNNYKIGETFKITKINDSYELHILKWMYKNNEKAISIKSLRKATDKEIVDSQIKLPIISGFQCIDNNNKTIICGCVTKSFDWILGVYYAMNSIIKIKDTNISREEIRQIVNYIDNNIK